MSTSIITINKLVDVIENISTRHPFIKSFGSGSIDNIPDNIDYPLLWVEVDSVSRVKGGSGHNVKYIALNLYLFDRLDNGNTNYWEVISDTDFSIDTMIAEITQNSYYHENSILIEGNIDGMPYNDDLADGVCGWLTPITFKHPLRYSSFNTPIEPKN